MSNRTLSKAVALITLVFGSLTAWATDLNLVLTSNGAEDRIVVCPGAEVGYQVVGSLSDTSNLGLAVLTGAGMIPYLDPGWPGILLADLRCPFWDGMMTSVSDDRLLDSIHSIMIETEEI